MTAPQPRPITARVANGVVLALLVAGLAGSSPGRAAPDHGRVPAGGVVRVSVPEAFGGKTVVGQLTVARAVGEGYVTGYGCADGLPRDGAGRVDRSDLNFDGSVSPVASNRLIVQADSAGDVCFYTSRPAALVVDVNGVADDGIGSFRNRRIDTRRSPIERVPAGGEVKVAVPEAVGGKTVVGQLTVARTSEVGFVTAYGCADGLPRDGAGRIDRSDLNFDGTVSPAGSNRLIVQADVDGNVCLRPSHPAALVVDVNGASEIGISSFPNRRLDTRLSGVTSAERAIGVDGVPVWPAFEPLGPVSGVAALTGRPAAAAVTRRPVVAVKIDNFRMARPQWGLDLADVVFEENVEGVTRFVALFHTHHPETVGPVRSARTGDLDLVAGMNRPVFAYSGANPGVTAWIASATSSGVLVDFTAQRRPCYSRTDTRPGPHNLLFDTACATVASPAAGPARPLWAIDGSWTPPSDAPPDSTFVVPMDGVRVEWTWDAGLKRYVRSQDREPHEVVSGVRISASNVVELRTEHVPSPVDARSPHPVTVGAGSAVVHRNGRAIPVVWSRSSPHGPFEFFHVTSGERVPLDVGVTFVELTRG